MTFCGFLVVNGEIICCQLELGKLTKNIGKLFSELKLITDNLLFSCDEFTLPEQSDWCNNMLIHSYNYTPISPVKVSRPYSLTMPQGTCKIWCLGTELKKTGAQWANYKVYCHVVAPVKLLGKAYASSSLQISLPRFLLWVCQVFFVWITHLTRKSPIALRLILRGSLGPTA